MLSLLIVSSATKKTKNDNTRADRDIEQGPQLFPRQNATRATGLSCPSLSRVAVAVELSLMQPACTIRLAL
jgi:hypothetical protein